MAETEQIVRRMYDAFNHAESADEVIRLIEPLLGRDAEWVNPPDAIERGIRRGVDGWRIAAENAIAGLGAGARFEIDEITERGDRALALGRVQPKGTTSGADTQGPAVGAIWTIRDGKVLRYEWFYGWERALGAFARTDSRADD